MAAFQLTLLVLMLLIMGAKALHTKRRGVNPFHAGVGKHGLQRLIECSLAPLINLWILCIVCYALGLDRYVPPAAMHRPLFVSAELGLVGAAIALLGAALVTTAFVHMGLSWRVGVADPQALVTRGIFTVTRNPIFLGLDVYCIGMFLTEPRPLLLVLLLLTITAVHWQITYEERYLRTRFGEAYAAYCSRVPRYAGWPRAAAGPRVAAPADSEESSRARG